MGERAVTPQVSNTHRLKSSVDSVLIELLDELTGQASSRVQRPRNVLSRRARHPSTTGPARARDKGRQDAHVHARAEAEGEGGHLEAPESGMSWLWLHGSIRSMMCSKL